MNKKTIVLISLPTVAAAVLAISFRDVGAAKPGIPGGLPDLSVPLPGTADEDVTVGVAGSNGELLIDGNGQPVRVKVRGKKNRKPPTGKPLRSLTEAEITAFEKSGKPLGEKNEQRPKTDGEKIEDAESALAEK
jgi:hypothetical protein